MTAAGRGDRQTEQDEWRNVTPSVKQRGIVEKFKTFAFCRIVFCLKCHDDEGEEELFGKRKSHESVNFRGLVIKTNDDDDFVTRKRRFGKRMV